LTAEERPKERKAEICADESHGERGLVDRRVREEARDGAPDDETIVFKGLGERAFSETEEVIPEIPVSPLHILDVGPEGDEAAAGAEAARSFEESELEGEFVGEVFEKIAREDDVQGGIGNLPVAAAVLKMELNIGSEVVRRRGIEVHRVACAAADVIDEFAVATAEVEDGGVCGDQGLEKIGDKNIPEFGAIGSVGGGKPARVNGLKFTGLFDARAHEDCVFFIA
jgi:hypothetical protein